MVCGVIFWSVVEIFADRIVAFGRVILLIQIRRMDRIRVRVRIRIRIGIGIGIGIVGIGVVVEVVGVEIRIRR